MTWELNNCDKCHRDVLPKDTFFIDGLGELWCRECYEELDKPKGR